MPSPHNKGKPRKNRKGKAPLRQRTETAPAAAEQQAAPSKVTTTAPRATAPRATAPKPAAGPRAAAAAKAGPARQYALPEYPFVGGELLRIGVLAVILVVILIVLSRILT